MGAQVRMYLRPITKESLGKRIVVMRLERKLAATPFAERLGIRHETLKNIETGRTWPALPVVREMANQFGVTLDELLDGDPA